MKFDKIRTITIHLIIISNSFLFAQDIKLTLEESLAIGLKNSKEMMISKSKINKAEATSNELYSSSLPSLSFSARYTRFSEVPPFEVDLPVLPDPFTIQEAYLNNYNLVATIEQPIFTGFRLSSMISAADYRSNAERINSQSTSLKVADKIREKFWRFYIAQQMVIITEKNLKLLNSHLVNTKSLLNTGLATKNDLLKLKVEVANSELRLVDAKNMELLAKADFNKIIGLPIDAATEITADDLEVKTEISGLNDLLEEAMVQRHELKSSRLMLNSLEKQEEAAMADWYPQLYAFGNFYYNNPNQRFLPLEDKFNDSWDVGVALKWKIWNWGGTSSKVEQAKQDYLIADKNIKLLEENIQMDVYSKYLNLEKTLKKIELSRLQLKSAEENYRITEKKYYQQLATSTDLIDAETSLLNSKISLVNSKVEYKIGLSALNTSIGRDNAQH